MTQQTLGWLWSRYFKVREREIVGIPCPLERAKIRRQARGLRDRLVVNYSPLVRYVAFRVGGPSNGTVQQEDIVSWGLCGLLDAVETYDPLRRAKFETYAISKIRWSILDELRKADPLPRSARTRARQAERAWIELSQTLRRTPTEAEVAARLGVSVADYRAFLERTARSQVGSLESRCGPESAEGGLHELLADHLAADPVSAVESAEVRAVLVRALERLGKQQRIVTTFYYYDGLTLREIGALLGLTEGRISQVLKASLANLREALAEAAPVPEEVPAGIAAGMRRVL